MSEKFRFVLSLKKYFISKIKKTFKKSFYEMSYTVAIYNA